MLKYFYERRKLIIRSVSKEEAQGVKAGAGHYHWKCIDGINFYSAKYSTMTTAAKAAQKHINKYPAHIISVVGVEETDDMYPLYRQKNVYLELVTLYKKQLIELLLFSIILFIVSMSSSFFYKQIIDIIELNESVVEGNYLIKLTISLGCSYLAMIVLFVLKGRSSSDVTRKFDLYLKDCFVKSTIAMPIEKFDDFSTGGILDRYSRIKVVSETLSNVIISVILEGVSLVVSSVILVNISAEMFRVILIIVVGYIIAYLLSKKQLLRLNRVLMEKESVIMTQMKEMISNILTLKVFGHRSFTQSVNNEVIESENVEHRLNFLSIVVSAIVDGVEMMAMLLVLFCGMNLVVNHTISIGTLLMFESFVGFFVSPVKSVLGLLPELQETMLTFHRLNDIYEYLPEKQVIENESGLFEYDIVFEEVTVSYGFENPILKNLSFCIKTGEKIFITGSSGSGKSSLAKAMSGLLSVTSGKIYLGKVEINQAKKDDISSSICYLPQEPQIFAVSIKENIMMWSDMQDEVLFDEIVIELGIDKLMSKRGLSMDSKLSENGDNLSGGEKQRIAAARALMRDVDIYIFDESTSHLDKESEQTILSYINSKLQYKTVVFISHNTYLYHNADKIIHLENGNIEMIGSHLHLMAESSSYKKLCCR